MKISACFDPGDQARGAASQSEDLAGDKVLLFVYSLHVTFSENVLLDKLSVG